VKVHPYASYDDYVAAQTEANKRKLRNVWVRPETVLRIGTYAPFAKWVLCHGTRNGAEQRMFKVQYPTAYVIGTEISDTASQFPDTVQHDFQIQRPEWVGNFDVVYSNSLDHALAPVVALMTWRDQLAPKGRLFIEHCFTPETNVSSAADPLEISREELQQLFKDAGLWLGDTFPASGVNGADDCASTVFVLGRA